MAITTVIILIIDITNQTQSRHGLRERDFFLSGDSDHRTRVPDMTEMPAIPTSRIGTKFGSKMRLGRQAYQTRLRDLRTPVRSTTRLNTVEQRKILKL